MPRDPLPAEPPPTPEAQADYDCLVLARDVWASHYAATALALTWLLPPSEAAHFDLVETAKGVYDAISTHYSTPSFASLSHILMTFVFPDLDSFATVSDLATHLCSLVASYRAACTEAQLLVALHPIWLTVHWVVTCLPDRLSTTRDAFLRQHPSELTIDLLKTTLGKIESNLLSVASATDAIAPCQFEGCDVPQLPTFTATRASAAVLVSEDTAAISTADWWKRGKGGKKGGKGGGGGGGGTGGSGGGGGGGTPGGGSPGGGAGSPAGGGATSGGVGSHPCVCGRNDNFVARCFRRLDGLYRARWGPEATTPRWAHLLARKIPVFEVSMDDARQYALYADVDYSADGSVCSRVRSLGCLPPVSVDLCLSSLGACVSALGPCVASGPGRPPAEASLSFSLDSGASHCFFRDHTTLTPLLAPVPVVLADPSSGPAVARRSTTLLCPVVPFGVLRNLHIPSFTWNFVGLGYLHDRGITITFVGGGRSAVCTNAATGAILATFTREPSSGLYVLHTERSSVTSSTQVAASPPVLVSSPVAVSNQITKGRAARTITLTHSHMMQQVLQRFGFRFSTTQPTPLAVDHRLTGPFPDEPFESSGPYVGACGLPGCHLCVAGGLPHPAVLTGHCDSSYVDDVETQRSTQGYCFRLGAGAVSWRSTRSSSVASSSEEAAIYAGANLGERPRSALTLYADNKAMILLC
ncbi:unnamed protein product [Closterium sp. NIES-53]